MRTPDAEKLGIANVERAWKAHGHGEQEANGPSKASGEGRSRARKGIKQKKQPQRGLGVAQLERLRMQEQSKIMGQNEVGAMYLRHNIKAGAISHHHHHHHHLHTNQWPLAVRNGRLIRGSPPDKGHMMHHGGRGGTMDVEDVLWTFMSPDHSRSVSLSRHERGHTVMSIMLPLGGDDRGMSGMGNHDHLPHIAAPLGKNVHVRTPASVNNPDSGTSADHHPREQRTNVPVVAGHGDKSKELSSVQNISTHHPRTAKSCGWKRPWQSLHESQQMHSNRSLDLNECSTFAADMDSGNIAVGHQSAHQFEGLIRAAAQEDCSTHPLKISLFGTRPSEFLTLGLSSYNSKSAQHEDRVQSKEAITTSEGNRSHADMCSKGAGGNNHLQLHLCNPQQAQVQRNVRPYPVVADEARFSHRFSSENLTEQCHKQTERKTESLDLRLKLAI